MKLFNRSGKDLNPNLPPEVKAYAQAEHRERVGMAWLVGIVSLLISLGFLALIYFGSVWIYRKVTGTENKQPTTSETTKKESDTKEQTPKDTDTSSDQTNEPSQTPEPTPESTPKTTPKTGDDSEDTLVRTGPDIDL